MRVLYGAPASVFVRKVAILLEEKGVGFVVDPVNPMLETSAEFKSISPLGKIPVFRDGDFTVADSSAICSYIEAKYPAPPFYPKTAEELAKALWYEEFADTALFQAIAPCYYQAVLVPLYRNRVPDEQSIQRALMQQLPPVADYLERQLIDKRHLVGHEFSIADVAVVSIFLNMHAAGFSLPEGKWPWLSSYLKLHFQRPSVLFCTQDLHKEVQRAEARKAQGFADSQLVSPAQ
nr:glutathione S-transferase family protein [Legionella jordanis]